MKPKWICYPNDFEMYLFNDMMNRRYERDAVIPPFWRMDYFNVSVKFIKEFEVCNDCELTIKFSKGSKYNIVLDTGAFMYDFNGTIKLNKGKHNITISVYNNQVVPAILFDCKEVVSDKNFIVTCMDGNNRSACELPCEPSKFRLPIKEIKPISKQIIDDKIVYDMGKEVMALIKVNKATSKFTIYLGESLAEALDFAKAETIHTFSKANEITPFAKAFRYIAFDKKYDYDFRFYFEYINHNFKPTAIFKDERLNSIYNMGLYTLSLNTREFFLDGIKRDRWVWAGDAYQSNLMTYYSFNDFDVIKRTMVALLAKRPYKTHINHIMDYSLFHIIGFYEYLFVSNDITFASENYEAFKDFIDFIISRLDEENLLVGKSNDWVFVDWSNLDNRGQVFCEQVLLYKALESFYKVGCILNKKDEVKKYLTLSNKVFKKLQGFYNPSKGYFEYNKLDGKFVSDVRKQPNIFAILFDICDDKTKNKLIDDVITNQKVLKITTPYMRFYELAALAKQGRLDYVMQEIKNYWGGMIDMGATSFWEMYDPSESVPKCYEAYGRAYGKSLCHAWGATPLYLIGKYFIGLNATKIGYEEFEIKPNLKYLGEFKMSFPINKGKLDIEVKGNNLFINYNFGKAVLKLNGKNYLLKKGITNVIEI